MDAKPSGVEPSGVEPSGVEPSGPDPESDASESVTVADLIKGQRDLRRMFQAKVRNLEKGISVQVREGKKRLDMLHLLAAKIDNFNSVYLSQSDYFQFQRDLEARIARMEQTLKDAWNELKVEVAAVNTLASTARDTRAVLREGTGSTPSVLTRLVRLEMDLVELAKWRDTQLNLTTRNRQMLWALVVMILSNLISISWAFFRSR